MLDRRAPVTCSPCLAGSHECAGACACPECHPRRDGPTHAVSQPVPPHAFRGPQVCKLVGITYRQLDYWARTGLARPSISDPVGSGYARLYSIEDVRMLVVLKAMLDAGISLQTARKALPFAREPEGLRWLLVGGPEPVMAAEGELERLCREIGVCTVVDLQREVVATSS